MVEIIPPRRDESAIGADGEPTLRFAEYLELLAGSSNDFELRITQNAADIAINAADIEFNRHYAYIGA